LWDLPSLPFYFLKVPRILQRICFGSSTQLFLQGDQGTTWLIFVSSSFARKMPFFISSISSERVNFGFI
jgi:hypothetical protein